MLAIVAGARRGIVGGRSSSARTSSKEADDERHDEDPVRATRRSMRWWPWRTTCCPRLQGNPQLGRFWAHRGEDGIKGEKQLLIDFLCASAGGPVYYRGRDMAT
jgi:hypothetical protein